jgi:peroxiredoxin
MPNDSPIAHPPETLEGWYCLHQIFRSAQKIDAPALCAGIAPSNSKEGWSIGVKLIGSAADVMLIHFRPTLDAISEAQSRVAERIVGDATLEYSFLSVTEAGLYHLTAELAKEAEARSGKVGDDDYQAELGHRSREQRATAHVHKRLYPELPPGMPYVCFYPMSKRRDAGQNWYSLSLEERSRLMMTHGTTGRRYAGRVQQVITGAIGFDSWEWGVTLFAADPLDFKKLVTDMRFDEVSAKYAEFGDFYVGRIVSSGE